VLTIRSYFAAHSLLLIRGKSSAAVLQFLVLGNLCTSSRPLTKMFRCSWIPLRLCASVAMMLCVNASLVHRFAASV